MDFIVDPTHSQATNKKRLLNLKTLSQVVSGQNHTFVLDDFANFDVAISKINDFFANPGKYGKSSSEPYTTETQLGYLTTIYKALLKKDAPSEVVQKYFNAIAILKNNKSIERSLDTTRIPIDTFLQTQAHLATINCHHPSIAIIIKLITLINIATNSYGVLRMDDLIHTCLVSDGEHSHLNLTTGLWTIQSKYTKNNVSRTFLVPAEFTHFVSSFGPRKWLLCHDAKPYLETDTLSKKFHEVTGLHYYDIRRQFVTYLQNNTNIEHANLVATNMGHSLITAISVYNKS